MSIKVILADDHAVVKDGIKAFFEKKAGDIKIIGEASNGEELLELAKKNPADVYIIDIAMPVRDTCPPGLPCITRSMACFAPALGSSS